MPDTNTPNQSTGEVQSQDSATQIVIDVENSLYAKHFEGNQLIHKDELENLKKAIKERIENNKPKDQKDKNKDSEERRSEAYTVFGTRGSGKSSFLYSLMHWCNEENQKGDILALDLIDPTLFEDKGHILLTIIAQLRHLVDEAHNKRAVENDEYGCNYEEWHKSFERLARGIPSIKNDGFIKDNWMESGFVMNQGVQDVYSAYTLEKSFSRFVDCSLEFLGKRLLVIVFDDIDIDFRRGWEVLETVRKYLTSKQVFVIISGDVKLFSKSIRKVQWKNFGKALLKNEAEREQKEDYNNLVTEMESQYMQKVMPTQYRIYLRSLLDIVANAPNSVMVGAENIRTYYNINLFQGYEPVNTVQTKVFTNVLLSLALRTQMQLMAAFKKSTDQPENLVMPFVSHLLDGGINYEDLLRFPNKLNAIILKFLVNNKIVEESYQLQPNTLDADINACMVALSLVSSRHYKNNAYLIFDYIVRVGFSRFVMYTVFPMVDKYPRTFNRGLLEIENFVKRAHMYNDVDLKVLIGNAIAYLDGLGYKGITKIYGLGEKAKDGSDIKRIDTVFKDAGTIEKALGYLPLTISKYTNRQASELNYSLVALLAAITDIVREASQKPKIENYLDENKNIIKEKIIKSERGQTIIEFLNYLSQTRNYIIPTDNDGAIDMTEADEIGGFSIDENDEDVAGFIETLSNWIDAYSGIVVPPYLLGKIATRAFASINSLDTSNDTNLGEAIHRRIIILLNAVLVEEAREYGYNLNNNNPSGNDKIYENNKNKFKENSDNNVNYYDFNILPFFKWIVNCPLLYAYIDLDLDDEFATLQITSVYKYLEQVKVKGSTPQIIMRKPIVVTPMAKKINFSAYKSKCLAIVKAHFPTPSALFAGCTDKQVQTKLSRLFNLVRLDSVESFREKYKNESGTGYKAQW
ncbi:MAG: KAP family NTPase [Paludibacteraceae bacterium]|nr:KAP family NTPase [Paludibacteraceae bacterium]